MCVLRLAIRCTSSDLIIGPSPQFFFVQNSPVARRASVGAANLPNRNKAVKHTLLRGTRGTIERTAQPAKPEAFRRPRGKAQDAQTFQGPFLFPVPHRQTLGDIFFLLQPLDGFTLVAEAIDKMQFHRLAAGKDPSIRDSLQLLAGHVPSLLHEHFEPGETVANERGERGTRFRTRWLEPIRRSLERGRLHVLHFHPNRVEQFGEVRILNEDADRTNQRISQRDNPVGSKGGNITAGGGHAPDHGNRRFLRRETADRIVEPLRSRGRAAGTVDRNQNRLGGFGLFYFLDQFQSFAIAGDDAFDGEPRNVRPETQGPIRSNQAEARDGGGQDQRRDGGDSPIGQFSPQDTALGKIIREKRRNHDTPGVRVSAAGPVRAGSSDLSRYQSRFALIGQPAARRRFGLIPNDPVRRMARQRRRDHFQSFEG